MFLTSLPGEIILAAAVAFPFVVVWFIRWLFRPGKAREILVDGSNVLYWKNARPDISAVASVVRSLLQAGYTPLVSFDANVGYKINHHWMSPRDLGPLIGLPDTQISVSPKGVPADGLLLTQARDYGWQIVTNDHFRDWHDRFPILRKRRDILISGHLEGNEVTLHFPQSRSRKAKV